jgi:predicted nuclease of predicted toxin-antitoxin system
MARLYSNENFPIDIVLRLREIGHDILTSYEAGQANQKIADIVVVSFATQENRIVITLNRDDFVRIHRTGIGHMGIIICKDDRDYDGQTQAIQTCLTANPVLSNRLIRIKKRNQLKAKSSVFICQEYAR